MQPGSAHNNVSSTMAYSPYGPGSGYAVNPATRRVEYVGTTEGDLSTGAGSTPTTTPTGFNYTPAPTTGRGAFGAVPGAIGVPSPAKDLAAEIPGLKQLNQEAAGNILTQLRGQLSPDTVNMIQDAAASWGVGAGVPGSGLQVNRGLRDVGQASEALQQQGQQNYGALTSAVSNTQTASPELQANVAIQNALNAAAPDPSAAALYSQSIFDQYLRQMNPTVTTESTHASPFIDSYRSTYDPLTGQTSTRRI